MGYCYTREGKLCCDICGATGARKYRCPFGYCQATAACPKCRKERTELFGRAVHRKLGCETAHAKFEAYCQERESLLGAGKAVRCSALGDGNGKVHVLFQRMDGSCEGWCMSTETYDALPLLANFTPSDYRKHGALQPAPAAFGGGHINPREVETMTLKEAYQRHPLARAVLKQLGGGREALDSARDAGQHGADAGWPGFTHYSDTCAFTNGHRAKIAKMAEEEASGLGKDVLSMIANFNCLGSKVEPRHIAMALYGGKPGRNDKDAQDGVTLVENALAWFALEEVGRALEDV